MLLALSGFETILYSVFGLALLASFPFVLGVRFIANDKIGIVEKLWSTSGSMPSGHIIALKKEAGFQAEVLRGGLHFFYWRWQYRVHRVPLTVVPQGKIGYVFARGGKALPPTQTLGHEVPCNNFQDVRSFICGGIKGKYPNGQKGRQRAILREGVYAINLAQFVVITEDCVYRLTRMNRQEAIQLDSWRQELKRIGGFDPVVIGRKQSSAEAQSENELDSIFDDEPKATGPDEIGLVTVHDGPSLVPGQIIAPPVGINIDAPNFHGNFQDIEAFLNAGGCRGRQFQTLTDGTYFINRWFATVELIPKTIVPIGHVGVVVSYFGEVGSDVSGESFRHGERVAEGGKGVQAKTLSPGKYAFNTAAGKVHTVPTTNFVLHWITGRTESHKYDESLKSIDLVTADAYEPILPLSVVVHIDYQKANNVVQRFGDVKRLITQTLDPLLSAYFRDIAHKKTMLELLHDRDLIQIEASEELRNRFANFDIELVDVLIGKPETKEGTGEIEMLLDQLRLRQLSREQVETYEQQCAAAEKLKKLKMAEAHAQKQTELTNSLVEISIAENRGESELVYARKKSEQDIVAARSESECQQLMAETNGKAKVLLGEGESKRMSLEGEAAAAVLQQKIESYGDPRLYALTVAAQYLAQSKQPLVPEHLFVSGSSESNGDKGTLGLLLDLLVREHTGFAETKNSERNSKELQVTNHKTRNSRPNA